MLVVPAKMVTDHFETPALPMTTFWIRGSSVALLANCYLLTQIPTDVAVKVATATTIAVGVLYPWNAKFNLIGDKLPVKYPMHYVPEILMAVMTALGLYCIANEN